MQGFEVTEVMQVGAHQVVGILLYQVLRQFGDGFTIIPGQGKQVELEQTTEIF